MMLIRQHRSRVTSRRSRELASRLGAVIAEFRRVEPSVSNDEIASALDELQGDDASAPDHRKRAILGTLAGAAVALGLGVVMSAKEHPANDQVWSMIGVGVVLVVVFIVGLARRRNR